MNRRFPLPRTFSVTAIKWAVAALSIALASIGGAAPEVKIARHAPCNLFNAGEPVAFDVSLKGFASGHAEAKVAIVDHLGKAVWEKTYAVDPAAQPAFKVDAGRLGRGYYELKIAVANEPAPVEKGASFGVMEFAGRSAKEAREGSHIFGIKWWAGIKNQREMLDAMCKLGLQWTRISLTEKKQVTTEQILTEYPMNAVIKVERFPAELYNEERYGPLAEWEKKYGRGAWTLKTLPKKEPYQEMLRAQLKAVPQEQQVFEIWNEAWDKMSPHDFATLCQWITEVILAERPGAVIGPNLYGSTSPYEYDARVIQAGGMKGMKMVALHPYAASEDRAWMREYRAWLKEQLGHDVDTYITEYGSHSTPEGPARRSEMEQARRVVRQSLALYAEGVKAIIPHWAGQTEQNRTYVEDWFGFVRKNEEPKPVLLAHANAARLIDGGRYLGDLWCGPEVAAMLFEKKGTYVLALWTMSGSPAGQGENRSSKTIEVSPGAESVRLTDIMGRETPVKAQGGKLSIRLDESPVYLVGVAPDIAKLASKELRPDRWPKPAKPPRNVRIAKKLGAEPPLDGTFSRWKGAAELGLLNPKVNGYDCSGTGYVAWDEHYLYVGADIRDNELLNSKPRADLYQQDSMELFVSVKPRESGSGYSADDFQFVIAPTSADGVSVAGWVADREARRLDDVKGAKLFGGLTHHADKGWAVEVAIPWSALGGIKPAKGTKLALEMRINDADTSHPRFKIDPVDSAGVFETNNPASWSLLMLEN